MGQDTGIEWCDSTQNPVMGCDGCELFNPKLPEDDERNTCYANTLVSRYAGLNGWPIAFSQPTIFEHRIGEALRWKDLTGTDRPAKPHLNGRPRLIFWDDLSDTWTESLPLDWLLPHMPSMAASPHVHLMLTKRPQRAFQFYRLAGGVPANFWPMTSVTSEKTIHRLDWLCRTDSPRRGVSVEPLFGDVARLMEQYIDCLAWMIVGGESGGGARPVSPAHVRDLRDLCVERGVKFFFKQWGEWRPFFEGGDDGPACAVCGCTEDRSCPGGCAWSSRILSMRDICTNCDTVTIQRFGREDFARLGKKKAGRLLDGREWLEVPEAYREAS